MLADYCTWDDDYNSLVTQTRNRLVDLSGGSREEYTAVLMQGSGTFAVEATIGSVVPPKWESCSSSTTASTARGSRRSPSI